MKFSVPTSAFALLATCVASAPIASVRGAASGNCKAPVRISSTCPAQALAQIDVNDDEAALPVHVLDTNPSESTVTVLFQQALIDYAFLSKKEKPSVDWIGTIGAQPGDVDEFRTCGDFDRVPIHGVFGNQTYACDASTNTARVEIFFVDDQLPAHDSLAIPESCDLGEFGTMPNRCSMVYEIPCGCDVTQDMKADTQRRLDATEAGSKPTESPTSNFPSMAPTSQPTNSIAPTTTSAPTPPKGPECTGLVEIPVGFQGELPFCYDGRGRGGRGRGRKGYTTCYTLDSDEMCGARTFYIEGYSKSDFLRCGDVWLWFRTCVDSYGCTFKGTGAKFKYGTPNRSIIDRAYKNEYEFRISGNGVSGTFKWVCETPDQAEGMKDFADVVFNTQVSVDGNQRSMFTSPVTACESEAPSSSMAPSMSGAPTYPVPISCKDELGYHFPWFSKKGLFMNKKIDLPTIKNKSNVVVTNDCKFTLSGHGVEGTEEFEYPLEWVKRINEVWGGTMLPSNAEFIGTEGMPKEDIIYDDCAHDATLKCLTFKQGAGVRNADLVFTYPSNRVKEGNKLRSTLADADEKIWQTYDPVNRCARSPPCSDEQYATCYATWNSENCAKWDFRIAGDPNKAGMVWTDSYDFLAACAESTRSCTPDLTTKNKFNYGTPNLSTQTKDGIDRLKFSGNGVSGQFFWNCNTAEDASYLRNFALSMKSADMFRQDHQECTTVPTQSPTACQDGFLTNPPVNILLAIDISYSTFNFTFGGAYSTNDNANTISDHADDPAFIADMNGDGRSNTILDAEIAAAIRMLKVIENDNDLSNDNVNIGVVLFETSAYYGTSFMTQGTYNPLNSDGDGINEQLLTDLKSIITLNNDYDVIHQNKGFTNFDDALDKSVLYFEDRQKDLQEEYSEWTNLMVFLSDGVPNIRGDGDDEDWCSVEGLTCEGNAKANKPDPANVSPWEKGELSFCLAGDDECHDYQYANCAHGGACEGEEAVKSFKSELDRLDALSVMRLAVGVGTKSDVSFDSALYRIDSNPFKDELKLLPKQVDNNLDLANVLRNLCFESTSNPTALPSAMPTSIPTALPTDLPTGTPTSAPTDTPTRTPSSEPTFVPTVDVCDYEVVDFTTTSSNSVTLPTGDGDVTPNSWNDYGMRIITNSKHGIQNAKYHNTGDNEAGKGIIVPDPSSGSMEIQGGDIIITFAMIHEKHMRLHIFDASDGFSITKVAPPNEDGSAGVSTTDQTFTGASGLQPVVVTMEGVYQLVISFDGPGVLSKIQLCRNPDSTPAPFGLSSHGSTDAPTKAPVAEPQNFLGDKCPGATLIKKNGDAFYSSLPIEVVEYKGSSVRFKVKQTFQQSVAELYTQYKTDAFDEACPMVENAVINSAETHEASCMMMEKIAIVDLYVSDPFLIPPLNTAVIPRCCHGPNGQSHPATVFTFEIKCADPCPSSEEEGLIEEKNRKLASDSEAEPAKHYCDPVQHPCGDKPGMVQVCHFSSKDGYKTFCVAATESDMVAYMPKDSCGPCASDQAPDVASS